MKKEYDLSKMKRRKNPYIKALQRPVTLQVEKDTVEYFKSLSKEVGLPYQNLINMYLRDCVLSHRKPRTQWVSS